MQEDKKIEEYVINDNLGEEERNDWREKLRNFIESRYFIPIVIVLIAITSFSLGRISGLQDKRPPVRIISESGGEVKGAATVVPTTPETITTGAVVASKNGTKYHYPWCAGAKQISTKNLITFNSIEEARAKGYTPAANCKGLK